MDDEEARLIQLMRENSRPVQGYWSWKDKPVAERDAARSILRVAGHTVSDLRSRTTGEDPPDCEAMVDGLACGIEVTELIHQKALERSLKEPRQYAIWTPVTFRAELQRIITHKDKPWKGGPYARRYLVIVTDEFMLMRDWVTPALQGATFQAQHLTDVLLGLTYHPSDPPGGEGTTPTFRLLATSGSND